MIVYIIIAVVLIINIINPRILWYIDSWKYKDAYIDGMIGYIMMKYATQLIITTAVHIMNHLM